MPKSKVRKKNDFTVTAVSRTPVKVKVGPVECVVRRAVHRPDADRPRVVDGVPAGRLRSAGSRALHWMAELGPWNYAIAFAFMITGSVAHDALALSRNRD